ncbi:MAG: UDP-2,3-diacylglucosamine diphosphatase [Planctomycetota bacterium]
MRTVRSVFVSDLHLGCRYANAAAFLEFLRGHQPEYLYLVGDMFDGWKLRKRWYWNETYSRIIDHVLQLSRQGTKVCYTPGNHDEFLRGFEAKFGGIEIKDEFIHTTASQRKLLVIHGDRFDHVESNAKWLSCAGDVAYTVLLKANQGFNHVRSRLGMEYWSISSCIKQKVKILTSLVSDFENLIVRYATAKGCSGIVCGHSHTPRIKQLDGFTYFNTGDWVESCTALVEYHDGELELLHRPLPRVKKVPTAPRQLGWAGVAPFFPRWGAEAKECRRQSEVSV